MKVLAGIILLHFLILIRGQFRGQEGMPWLWVFVISLAITGYVVLMMYLMEEPAR